MVNRKTVRRMCALTVAGLVAGGASAQINLDDFSLVEDNLWPIELNSIDSMFNATEFDGIGVGDLLTRRNTIGEFESADIVDIDEAEVGIFAGPGLLNYSSFAGAEGKLTLTYDGLTGTGLGQSLDGQDMVVISLDDYDGANDAMQVSVGVLFSDMSTADGSDMVSMTGAQDISIPIAFSGADVESITIMFEPDKGTDFRLDGISIVPEPAAAFLLALGGVLFARRA